MNIKTLKTALVISLTMPVLAMAKIQIAPGSYNVDPMHSKVGFEVPHLVISSVEGRFEKFEGKIIVDKNVEKSKVDVTIDTSSINTGVAKRDDHLKSADFFDVTKANNSKMTFVSKKITEKDGALKISGTLTIKGNSKDVTLDASYLGQVKDGYGQDKIAFKAKTKINRKDFGLTWNSAVEAGPVVGDEVEISLNIQAALAK